MSEQDRQLQKLLQIKKEIESDLEKQGKLKKKPGDGSGSRARLSLSEDIKRRLGEKKGLAIGIETVFILSDLDEFHAANPDIELIQYLRAEKDRISNPLHRQNMEGLICLLEKQTKKAQEIFQTALKFDRSDYVTFNFLETLLFDQKLTQEMVAQFFKDFPTSPYPLLLIQEFLVFHLSSAESVRKWLDIFQKTFPQEQYLLFDHLWNFRIKDLYSQAMALYRTNHFKEFHSICIGSATLFDKELGNPQLVSDMLKKRKDYPCTRLFDVFYSRQFHQNQRVPIAYCPFGLYIYCKQLALEKNGKRIMRVAQKLLEIREPYGFVLKGVALFNQGNIAEAKQVWFELLKVFETLTFLIFPRSTSEYKGLGLSPADQPTMITRYEAALELDRFSAFIDSIIERFGDFEFFLFPYEEYRVFFGHRKCSRAYDLADIMKGGDV